MNLNASQSNIISKFNYRDFIIFIVPVLIFFLYLMVYNPGVLTVASYSQLHQIAAGKFTTAYPILHTLLVIVCLKIFGSVFFVGLFQILVFSAMWMAICKYHRNDAAKSSNEFVAQFIVTLIICLIPINAVYSVTLSSNVLFSYSLLFLAFLIKIMLDKREMDTKLAVLMAVTLAVMSGLNNYGIIIAVISMAAIAFYLFKNAAPQNTMVKFVGIAVLCILLIGSLNLIYDVKGDNYDAYTLNVNVPVNDAFEEDINIRAAQEEFFSSTGYEPEEAYENADPANLGKSNYNIVDSFVDFWRGNFILDGLFDNPIICMILSIILLALIFVMTDSNEIFLIYVPTFISLLFSLITGQNNFYASILTLYLIVIIGVSFFFHHGMNVADLTKAGQIRSRPQSLQTPPAYEAQESYDDDSYYSYLESEIEELTLDDINEMLGTTSTDEPQKPQQAPVMQEQVPREAPRKEKPQNPTEDDDLLEQILREIEMEKN